MKKRLVTLLFLVAGLTAVSAAPAAAVTDPNVCNRHVGVYLYDRTGLSTAGAWKLFCGNSNNQILIPKLSAYIISGSTSWNNLTSSLKVRNLPPDGPARTCKFFLGDNYDTQVGPSVSTRVDWTNMASFGSLADNNLSSFYCV